MNSADNLQNNVCSGGAGPSGSSEDNNANLNNIIDQSKGAIPKMKDYVKNSILSRKNLKLNNNLDNMATLNGFDELGTTAKINGFSNTSINFLDFDEKPKGNCKTLSESLSSGSEGVISLEHANSVNTPSDEYDNLESSSDENLSVSDDGCIYTYKGADLPSSFFNMDHIIMENIDLVEEQNHQRNSSPEMDFLEMDFDPGQSGEMDSDTQSTNEQIQENPPLPPIDVKKPDFLDIQPCCSKSLIDKKSQETNKPVSLPIRKPSETKIIFTKPKFTQTFWNRKMTETKMPWSCTESDRTRPSKHLRIITRHQGALGELVSPKDFTPSPTNENLHIDQIVAGPSSNEMEEIMIWSEQEARLKQISQIGPSACGATAVLNVLNALRLPLQPLDQIQNWVLTNLRANTSPLPDYLMSRSKAGCTHREIIYGLHKASGGRIYARFFSMYPERMVNLHKFLGFWIKQGGVPIATLNIQKSGGHIPDSWHHQMIFGVGPNGIYLTNPVECVDASLLWPQLVSESVLLVKREDVTSRWNPKADMTDLMKIHDTRWWRLNVLGQVAKVVREQRRSGISTTKLTPFVQVPAETKSGITIAIDFSSHAYRMLQSCPELPLL